MLHHHFPFDCLETTHFFFPMGFWTTQRELAPFSHSSHKDARPSLFLMSGPGAPLPLTELPSKTHTAAEGKTSSLPIHSPSHQSWDVQTLKSDVTAPFVHQTRPHIVPVAKHHIWLKLIVQLIESNCPAVSLHPCSILGVYNPLWNQSGTVYPSILEGDAGGARTNPLIANCSMTWMGEKLPATVALLDQPQ